MNEAKLYYTPPSDECFEDLRSAAIALWKTYDKTFGYVDEKVNAIKDIKNIKDNFMYMFAMFDFLNQKNLVLKEETKQAINDRLVSGGSEEYLLL